MKRTARQRQVIGSSLSKRLGLQRPGSSTIARSDCEPRSCSGRATRRDNKQIGASTRAHVLMFDNVCVRTYCCHASSHPLEDTV